MDPCNNLSVLPPPINTVIFHNEFETQNLRHTCTNIIKVLTKQSPLHMEGAILSRFIYKFDKKFRSDIGYRNLKKVNTALRRYLSLNLLKDVESFVSVLPKSPEDKYIPTQQMLQYILIRIITFSKLMLRICVSSKQAAVYYLDRVKRGEAHWMSLMPYALVSRTWSISVVLLQHSCSWYPNLYKYLDMFKSKGLDFLPENYTLPTDLSSWLDIKNLDSYGRLDWSNKKNFTLSLNIIEDDDLNLDNILDYVKDVNEDINKNAEVMDSRTDKIKQEDTFKISTEVTKDRFDEGESISREYFQSFFKNNGQKDLTRHSADCVTSKITLDSFLAREQTYRNESNTMSLTKHLSFMQWETLKTNLINLSNSLAKNRKIERKFQKIWKEKCLDYNV